MSVDGSGSTIHLHRRWTLDNTARDVAIDDLEAAQVRNDERLELQISSGEHRIPKPLNRISGQAVDLRIYARDIYV